MRFCAPLDVVCLLGALHTLQLGAEVHAPLNRPHLHLSIDGRTTEAGRGDGGWVLQAVGPGPLTRIQRPSGPGPGPGRFHCRFSIWSLKDAGVALKKKHQTHPHQGAPGTLIWCWPGVGGIRWMLSGGQRFTGALKHVRNCRYLWSDDLLPGAPCFLALVDQDREKHRCLLGLC